MDGKYLICYTGPNTGMIIFHLGDPLDGFLVCDGSLVSKKDYRELYAIIRDEYAQPIVYRTNKKWYEFWKPRYREAREKTTLMFRLPNLNAEVR